ncbi:hypothetical protein [Glycomyces salinus]|uniref:hypothetical protein n=1 Tax=Glycomyces salinus TaxID=980294 RepID=UPI0018ED1E88|nr:hypothetical protein [Glycomyces salinus]
MPADFWPNAWFALGVTLVAMVPAAIVIAIDAAGLRKPSRSVVKPRGRLRRAWRVFSVAFGWAVLSGWAAYFVGLVGFTAFSGPEGEPVHIGEIAEVDECSRNGVALWLSYRCDFWVEVPTLPEGEIDRFRTITTSAIALEPGDPAGLWPDEETADGRMLWDVHPMSQTERPYLAPGRNTAMITTAALAVLVMVVWSRLRPVPLGEGKSFLDDWGSGGGGDTGGGDGGGGD